MADEYKALTHINLPFLDGNGRYYAAGSMIPHEAFEESAQLAEEAINDPDTETPSAEDQIATMIEWGSLSEDPEAELHRDHRPSAPGTPTISTLIEEAKILKAQYEEAGEEVPPEVAALAEARAVDASDEGSGASA